MKKYTSSTSLIKTVFIVLLTAWFSSPSTAQTLESKRFTLDRENFVDTIKIKIWDGAIVVPVEIAGKTRNMMFDTGAQTAFWIGAEEDWMMPSGDSIKVYDSQNQSQKKAIIKFPSIKMGNTSIENYPMIVDEGMGGWTCGEIDGGLGCDLVAKGLSFKFDTKDSLMIVTDRKGFFSKEEKRQPKLKYEPYKSYYMVCPLVWVDFPWGRAKMIFDLGCVGGWVDIPEPFLKRWAEDHPKIRQKINDYTVDIDTSITTSAGLFGRSEDTMLYRRLHFPEITMGDLALHDLWISTNSRMIKTGSAVLERTSLIIDCPKKWFVFLPHDGNKEIVVGNENKKGVTHTFAVPNDTLGAVKAVVRKGSEAYQKGIRTGDYLISVNGVPITDYCTYFNLDTDDEVKHYVYRSPEGEIKEVEW